MEGAESEGSKATREESLAQLMEENTGKLKGMRAAREHVVDAADAKEEDSIEGAAFGVEWVGVLNPLFFKQREKAKNGTSGGIDFQLNESGHDVVYITHTTIPLQQHAASGRRNEVSAVTIHQLQHGEDMVTPRGGGHDALHLLTIHRPHTRYRLSQIAQITHKLAVQSAKQLANNVR